MREPPAKHPEAIRPYNSAIECGLRALYMLDACPDRHHDLQRLITYDYLLVHSGDVEDGPSSLHPATPYRGGELLVKREAVRAGLDLMFSRELLDKVHGDHGIGYRANTLTSAFLALLHSPYGNRLADRAKWLAARFRDESDAELASFMQNSIGRWGAEFEQIGAIEHLEF